MYIYTHICTHTCHNPVELVVKAQAVSKTPFAPAFAWRCRGGSCSPAPDLEL